MTRFYALIFGAFTTSIGSGMTVFASAAFAYTYEGTAAVVGLIHMCAFAPIMLFGPIAGVLADRHDRRTMMLVGDGGSILGLLLLIVAFAQPRPSLGLMLAGLTISASLAALTEPALRATASELVPADQFVRCAGLLQLASSAKFLISPALAAAVLALANVQVVVMIDIATVFVTLTCTLYVRHHLGAVPARTSDTFLAQLAQGWAALRGNSSVMRAVVLVSVLTLALGILQTLIKPILLPHYSVEQVGIAETVTASGMIAGAVLISTLGKVTPRTLLAIGVTGVSIGMVFTGLSHNIAWVTTMCFLIFIALSACNAGADVIVRTGIPQDLQGRAWGVISLVSQLGFIIAYAFAGPSSDAIGASVVVTATGACVLFLIPAAWRVTANVKGDHRVDTALAS